MAAEKTICPARVCYDASVCVGHLLARPRDLQALINDLVYAV